MKFGKFLKILALSFSQLLAIESYASDNVEGGRNAIGMEFVRIRAGSFMMGSPENEIGRDYFEKQHHVWLTNDYEIQTTSVTQKQYFDVIGLNPSLFVKVEHCPETFVVTQGTPLCPNNPVEMVSWDDAQAFIKKLNAKRDGYRYRLPTEAEWEFAARGGTASAYSFGDDARQLPLYAWYDGDPWGDGNSGGHTHEVAQLRPNSFGLYDVHGNVHNWVQDFAGEFHVGEYDLKKVINPKGPSRGYNRLTRGSSFLSAAVNTRSAFRGLGTPHFRYEIVGIRLVRTKY